MLGGYRITNRSRPARVCVRVSMSETRKRSAADAPARQFDLERIRAEYGEMPGLRLTCEQVARLCGVERDACAQLLEALVETRYLERREDGCYARPIADRITATAPHARRRRGA